MRVAMCSRPTGSARLSRLSRPILFQPHPTALARADLGVAEHLFSALLGARCASASRRSFHVTINLFAFHTIKVQSTPYRVASAHYKRTALPDSTRLPDADHHAAGFTRTHGHRHVAVR